MARRSANNRPEEFRRGIVSGDSTEFSLESILAEYRESYAAQEPEDWSAPEPLPAEEPEDAYLPEDDLRPEEEYEDSPEEYDEEYEDEEYDDGVYAEEYLPEEGDLYADEDYEDAYEDEDYEPGSGEEELEEDYDGAYEEDPYEEEFYEEEPLADEYPDDGDVKIYQPAEEDWTEDDGDLDIKIYAPSRDPEPEEDYPPEDNEPERTVILRFDEEEEVLEEQVEGFEDDGDFYAGSVSEEEAALEEEARQEAAERRKYIHKGGLMERLFGGVVGLLAAASVKRRQQQEAPDPEPENYEREMPPRKAAKFYAGQMQSLKKRALAAGAVCLLMAWVTLAYGKGWSLPGGLENDIKLASMFCVVSVLTVMLLGLDVITSGVMSLLRGRPGTETLIVVACLASLADAIAAVLTDGGGRGLSYGVIPAVSVAVALWAAWLSCRGYKHTFLSLYHAKDPYSVTAETIPGREHRYLIKSRRAAEGFIRRSEEPNAGEAIGAMAAPFLILASLVLSIVVILVSKDAGAFFHVFAMMTALSASFLWLPAFPLFFARSARHLLMNGSAIAGWSGVRDIGLGRHLILTDTDVFPDGTVEIIGMRIPDKAAADQVVSVTGSLLAAAGVGMASAFTELMRRSGSTMQTVEEFTAGEGGIVATMDNQEVRVGSAGYMHLNGVKIPSRMKQDDALYTAVGGKLAGVFLFNYRASANVQRALNAMRRGRRKPIFAMRDFNIDPLLIRKKFGVSSEGFEFPSVPERYRISGVPAAGESPAAAVMARDGLDMLVEVSEYGVRMYTYGRLCAFAALISAAAGMVLLMIPCLTGLWSVASAANVLLYMLVWLAPMFVMLADLKK